MSTEIDPNVARQIARNHIRSGRGDIGMSVIHHFGTDLTDEEFFAWESAVHEALPGERRTVSWPDERPTVEQDCAYGRLREFADACDPGTEIIAGPPRHDAPYLSLSDLEAVLNGHVALERIAEDAVAELNARTPKAGESR